MTTTTYLRCSSHPRNLRAEFVSNCAQFVRSHWHVAGECRRWDGLTNGEHAQDHGLKCETCARTLRPFTVVGRETETECGDKCTSATGPACECKCKGENHGVAA